jgi:hypothetical protein
MVSLDNIPSRTADLAIGAIGAFRLPWLNVPRGFLGDRRTYPPGFKTELAALRRLDLLGAAKTVLEVGTSFPGHRLLFRDRSGPQRNGVTTVSSNERWFFINGICTDLNMAKINQTELSNFVGRPIQLLYNATDGITWDVAECVLGKAFTTVTESVAPNLAPLVDALCDPSVSRVVFTSHSQGTIIAAVMLKILDEMIVDLPIVPLVGSRKISAERKKAREMIADPGIVRDRAARESFENAVKKLEANRTIVLAKLVDLEVYCFANCATSMVPFHSVGKRLAPFIESYGNQNDPVARLGILAAEQGAGGSRIEGDRYYSPDAWGHLLNAHYLASMLDAIQNTPPNKGWKPFRTNLRQKPRLWDYYQGSSPAGWP